VSDLKPKETLREVLIVATPVNADEIDLLSADVKLQDKAIAKITNMFLGNLDDINLGDVDDFAVEAFGDDWGADGSGANDTEDTIKILGTDELDSEPVRADLTSKLQKELDTLRSQHEFECEYVDQLEQEIISITNDRDRQVQELTTQILRQASKAAEYEAAIQHWKEQSVRHQHHSLQLSAALDRLLADKPLKHLIEASSQAHNEIQQEQEYPSRRSSEAKSESFLELNPEKSPERSFRPNSKVDLPAFLVRHR
jgi:hypothetical protein